MDSFLSLTVFVAKILVALKIVEFVFAGIVVVGVLLFVGVILFTCRKDIKTSIKINRGQK